MAIPRTKETDLAQWADAWLRWQGFETWYEVEVRSGRADIIACRGSLLWIVECKVSLSLEFVMQLHDRLSNKCNGVLGVVPGKNRSCSERVARRFLAPHGIGLLSASPEFSKMVLWPSLRRLDSSKLRASLRDEHRRGVPGSQSEYWTPFKSLVEELQATLKPGLLSEAAKLKCISNYKDRAPSAQRQALTSYLRSGLIPGWTVETVEGRLHIVRTS